MKHFLPAFLILASAVTAAAEVQVTVVPENEKSHTAAPARVLSTADVLCEEDFRNFTEGSEDEPEFGVMLAYEGSAIEDFRTLSPGWLGHKVFEAGGVCALQTYDPYVDAYIATPAGDYSGSVRVTFRAKYLVTEWENEDGTKSRWTGSTIKVALNSESQRNFETSEYGNDLMQLRLYPDQGWCEITLDFDNYNAYNDAHLLFQTDDSVLIDNIKVTSSADKFIVSPEVLSVRDITETSFTVDFEPVRKAYNYYLMLYTCEGTDPQTGEPRYIPVLDNEMMALLDAYGMSVEEYAAESGLEIDSPYLRYDIVEGHEPKTFTYTGLDPEKEYFFAIRSHYMMTFSEPRVLALPSLPVPAALEAEAITDTSFTARWQPIAKADTYDVSLYGATPITEDTEDFIVFEEDFNRTSAYTDRTDPFDPTIIDEMEDGLTLDDFVNAPGWEYVDSMGWGFYALLNEGMIAFTDPVITPTFFCGSSDNIYVHLDLKAGDPGINFTLTFADEKYSFRIDEDYFEDYITLPTYGIKEGRLKLSTGSMNPVYIDNIAIGADVRKGDIVYTPLQKVSDVAECEYTFTGLDNSLFDMYAYGVTAVRTDDGKRSAESERMLVDLTSGSSFTGVGSGVATDFAADRTEVARYALDGTELKAPVKGVNIIRYSDGSTRKVIVK